MTIFRHTRATRMVVSALALAGVLLLTIATGGFAACTSDADAAQKASSFVANPSSLLNGPNGPRSVDDGTGLGKASNDCKVPDLAFATEIQIQLAGAGSAEANAQYAAVTGNNSTGTVAAGCGGAGTTKTIVCTVSNSC